MLKLNLSDAEVREIDDLLTGIFDVYEGVEDPAFLRRATLLAQRLPERLREQLLEFRLLENEPVAVVSGFVVDDNMIGPTPAHWRDRFEEATRREDLFLMLCCQMLGDAVAWATEQAGRMIHDVLPIQGNAGGQLGTSTDGLEWHTEDAFHPDRMDYVALMCLRNEDGVATTFAGVEDLKLDEASRAALSRPAFPYQPDEGNRADADLPPDVSGLEGDVIRHSHAMVKKMYEEPERVPALFGGPSTPYLRVHPYYVADFEGDESARDAFENLKTAVNDALDEVVLAPGDLLIIDNYTSVHGRREIPGRYDGRDRWLKRAFVVRDLRKTRHLRLAADARVVY